MAPVDVLGDVDFAGDRPVVLVQMAVEIDAPVPDRVVQLAEILERLRGDRQRKRGTMASPSNSQRRR